MTIMISGFVKHLKTLEGKNLPQIILPNANECLEILENTLRKTPDLDKKTLSSIPSPSTKVGPIFAQVPLEIPPSFVPASKALFFTGHFHLEPAFSKDLGSLGEALPRKKRGPLVLI